MEHHSHLFIPEVEMLLGSSFIQVSKHLIKTFGLIESVILANLIEKNKYFVDHHKIEDRWFFLKMEDQARELNISLHILRKGIAQLQNMGVLIVEKRDVPAKYWYYIDDVKIDELVKLKSLKFLNSSAQNFRTLYNKTKENNKKEKDISPEMKFQGRPSENSDSDNSEKKNLPNDKIKNHHINFSKRILLEQQKRYPTLIKKIDHTKVNSGAVILEQLERLDGYDFKSEIKPCLLWAIEDDFWSRNILSCAALRQKGKNGESKFTNILNAWQREDKTTSTSRSGGVALPPQNPYPPEATRDFENFLTDPSPKNLAQLYRNLQGIEKWVQGIDLKYYEKHPLVYSQYSRWKNYADKLVEWIMAKGFPTADNIGPYVFDVNGTIWKRFVDQCLLPDVFAKDHIKMKGDRY